MKNRQYAVYISLLCLCILLGCSRNPEITKKRYLESGQQYARKGKYEEARIQFTRAIKVDARFVDAYYYLGLSDVALHDWNGAFGALDQALALDPTRQDVRLELGQLYLIGRKFDLAQESANTVLQSSPRNTFAYRLLGDALLAKNDQQGAFEAFSKFLELAPEQTGAQENVGLLEAKTQRYADAEQHLRKAIEIDPRFVQGYLNLAVFYRSRNQSPAADQVLEKGIGFNPDAIPLYLSHADLWDSEAKKDLAEQELRRLRDRKTSSAEVSLAVGDYYSQHGELEAALKEYRRGLSGEPTNIDLKHRAVEAYLESGATAEAETLNDSVLKDKPKDVTAQVQRGRILLASVVSAK